MNLKSVSKMTLLLLVFTALFSSSAPAQDSILDELEEQDPCSIDIFSSVKQFQAGVPFQVGVLVKPLPGWHGYWHSSRDGGDAPEVIWSLPEGWKVSEPDYPVPTRMVEDGNLISIGYKKPFLIRFSITPAIEVDGDQARISIPVKVIWQVCEKTCIYGQSESKLSISGGSDRAQMDAGGSTILARWRDRYPIPAAKARGFRFEQQWIPDQGSDRIRKGTWVVRWSRKGTDRRPAVPLQWVAFPHAIQEGAISEARVVRATLKRARDSDVENVSLPGWEVRFELEDLGSGFHPGLLGVTLVPTPGKALGPVPGMPAITIEGSPRTE